jgi:histidine kinase
MDHIVVGTDRLTNTIRLGTQYAMMLNSRDDINQIINNIGRQAEIENIRIYNKEGQIKFSKQRAEVDQITKIKAEACYICHKTDPPRQTLTLSERVRIFNSPKGHRLLGIITPICNDPGCATGQCHFHPMGKKILGALDVVVSLSLTDKEIVRAEREIIGLAIFVFLITSAIIFVYVLRFVNQPITKLIEGTRLIAKGAYAVKVDIRQDDEIGQMAKAISQMGEEISRNQAALNKQRDEYQSLFEQVPCLITVQDRDYRLLRYNREFARRFDPRPGDFCYSAYKGRDCKCVPCPVEQTYSDGRSHYAEESGISKDGKKTYWIVRTSPITDANGRIVATMEISLDITERKNLEFELEKSEKKYHAIFSNIPNPVFVLDSQTLEILDCNKSVKAVYGYSEEELQHCSFLDIFPAEEKNHYATLLKTETELNQVKHVHKDSRRLFVNIRISPSEYTGRSVLLVTTSDITKRLEAEQQLIQASKMATLGEMATGVAHELNQPLSVIKTASSFLVKKIGQNEPIEPATLTTLLTKVDSNVDRAGRIIHHMRQFARKSELSLALIQPNEILQNAFEIFSQQLKVRGIQVVWEIQDDLPRVKADPSRLEQVFINLLLNARDAIEEKRERGICTGEEDRITIRSDLLHESVVCEICDTGCGIPAHLANKVFEPFFTTKQVGKGTGLGLSISYGIVKECQGDIQVLPAEGGGACFKVVLPVNRQAQNEGSRGP